MMRGGARGDGSDESGSYDRSNLEEREAEGEQDG